MNTPAGHDVALSVKLNFDSDETSNSFRAYLYINSTNMADTTLT